MTTINNNNKELPVPSVHHHMPTFTYTYVWTCKMHKTTPQESSIALETHCAIGLVYCPCVQRQDKIHETTCLVKKMLSCKKLPLVRIALSRPVHKLPFKMKLLNVARWWHRTYNSNVHTKTPQVHILELLRLPRHAHKKKHMHKTVQLLSNNSVFRQLQNQPCT